MTEAGIIILVKYIFGVTAVVAGFVLAAQSYNKRKIEEAREGSAGREALDKIDERLADMQKEHDGFKKDVFEMLFKR